MTGKFQAYPKYKSSSIEWLDHIPIDWGISRLKYCANIFGRIGFRGYTVNDIVNKGEGALVLSPSNIDEGRFTLEKKAYLSWDKYYESPEIMVTQGDILLVKTGSTFGKSTTIRKINEPMTINPQMVLIKSSNIDSQFLDYLFKSTLLRAKIDINNTGSGMPTMTQENINCFPIPKPPADVAIKIANFLDHETAKIDTLIEKQQALIQLLKEKRQAVISHAVTKGLDPDAPMRDSGVEWLGEVPAHWVVRRLKHTSTLQSGIPKGKDLSGKVSIKISMLRVANVQDGYLNLNDIHEMEIEPNQLERYALRYGDVLMNEGGDNDKLGRGAIWKSEIEPCIHQNHVFAIRPFSIEPEWLDLLTRASYAKFYFFRVAKQSTNLASISSTNIKETPLTIPPKKERTEIINHVFEKVQSFNKAEDKCLAQIALLQERRTALVSAAVTGKIDVREWEQPNA